MADLFHVRSRVIGEPPGPSEVRETLEELGPTFIKLGQVLSTRPDIIPPEYASELEKLQDAAREVPTPEILSVIDDEFGKPVGEVFAYFDPVPLAAASLGQTHLATLFDGREIVVKIQRPGTRAVIENDLEIITGLARSIERHFPRLEVYGIPDLADEFAILIREELDYTREGRNADRLAENLADLPYVKVASVIWNYTTSRVLTTERIKGIKITDIHELETRGYSRSEVAGNLWRAFLQMVFINGLFHGDPHPGNVEVLEDNVIGLLDYGMVGHLDQEQKAYVTMLLSEYVQQDSSGFSEVLLAMGTKPRDLNHKAFSRDIDRVLRPSYGAPIGELRIGEILQRSMQVSAKHKVRLPANMALLIKVIILIEGIDRQLDPSYDLSKEAKQFIHRSVREEFRPSRLNEQLIHSVMYWKWLLLELPHRLNDVMNNLAEGSFRIVFKHEGLEEPAQNISRSANRLSFAIMSSATIVASALVVSSKVGPLWKGFSIIGLVGFILAFLLTMSLMISIIRSGKLW
jgi:ubiquinone biosynthesis protein